MKWEEGEDSFGLDRIMDEQTPSMVDKQHRERRTSATDWRFVARQSATTGRQYRHTAHANAQAGALSLSLYLSPDVTLNLVRRKPRYNATHGVSFSRVNKSVYARSERGGHSPHKQSNPWHIAGRSHAKVPGQISAYKPYWMPNKTGRDKAPGVSCC